MLNNKVIDNAVNSEREEAEPIYYASMAAIQPMDIGTARIQITYQRHRHITAIWGTYTHMMWKYER